MDAAASQNKLYEEIQDLLKNGGATDSNLQLILEKILTWSGCTTGTLHSFDAKSQMLLMRAKKGLPDMLLEKVRAIPIGKGMAGLAAQRKEPIQVCNLQTDESGVAKPSAKETKVAGSITVPLMVGADMRGTLGIAKTEVYEFGKEEIDFLMKLGNLMGQHFPPSK